MRESNLPGHSEPLVSLVEHIRGLIIAATAVVSDRVLVTADARGFTDLPGVEVRAV